MSGGPQLLYGLHERQRHSLSKFLSGVPVITNTPVTESQLRGGGKKPHVVKRLMTQSAKDFRFSLRDGMTQTVEVSLVLHSP
jgi:hypothetical protein